MRKKDVRTEDIVNYVPVKVLRYFEALGRKRILHILTGRNIIVPVQGILRQDIINLHRIVNIFQRMKIDEDAPS